MARAECWAERAAHITLLSSCWVCQTTNDPAPFIADGVNVNPSIQVGHPGFFSTIKFIFFPLSLGSVGGKIHLVHLLVSIWTHGFLFYSVGHKTLLSLFILILSLSQMYPLKALQTSSCEFLNIPIILWVLVVWHKMIFQVRLLFSLPKPWAQPFLQGNPSSCKWIMIIRS